MSIAALIAESCRRFGDRTALLSVRCDDPATVVETWTYRSLFEALSALIGGLRWRGMQSGDRLAVLAGNSAELVLSEWACLSAGFLWAALNVRSSREEMQEILADCLPRILLVGPSYAAQAAELHLPAGCAVIVVGSPEWQRLIDSGAAVVHEQGDRPAPSPTDPVRIRYTSGTSGRAKGAVITEGCYEASVEAVGEIISPIQASDTLVQVAPMTHASGAMLLPHVRVGARALLLDRFEAEAFLQIVEDTRGTSVFLVPTMLVRILELPGIQRRLASLRTIVYGGASMPVDRLCIGLEALGQVFVQIYGLTESTWPVTALRREQHPLRGDERQRRARLASCGRATSVGRVRVVRADGSDAADGEAGEILVRGRNTMKGYWCGPGRAPARSLSEQIDDAGKGGRPTIKGLDEQGWMHTGDVGFRDADGFFTIIDRMHDMIVSGGFNIYPVEVERALSSHPAVLESAVVGVPDAEWGERVHASVVLRPGARVDEAELVEHCAGRISPFKKPRSLSFVRELPKNASGKILRRRIRERVSAGETGTNKNAPRG